MLHLGELVPTSQSDTFSSDWCVENKLSVMSGVLPCRSHRHLGSKVHTRRQVEWRLTNTLEDQLQLFS